MAIIYLWSSSHDKTRRIQYSSSSVGGDGREEAVPAPLIYHKYHEGVVVGSHFF